MTPAEVLQMGSFGGTYFRPIRSGVTQQSYKNVHKEFPDEWFEGLSIAKEVTSSKYDIELNRYKVKSGTDLADWEKSGWISALGIHIYICNIYVCHLPIRCGCLIFTKNLTLKL